MRINRPTLALAALGAAMLTPSSAAAAQPDGGGPGDPRRFSMVGHFEVDLVGLAVGLRADVLYRPLSPDGGFNVRLGVGVLPGQEFFFLPISVGWRQHITLGEPTRLVLGLGYEHQIFFLSDHPPVERPAFYAELGLDVEVVEGGWLGVQVAPDFAPFYRAGFGFAVRVGMRWDFGGRSPPAPKRATGGPSR